MYPDSEAKDGSSPGRCARPNRKANGAKHCPSRLHVKLKLSYDVDYLISLITAWDTILCVTYLCLCTRTCVNDAQYLSCTSSISQEGAIKVTEAMSSVRKRFPPDSWRSICNLRCHYFFMSETRTCQRAGGSIRRKTRGADDQISRGAASVFSIQCAMPWTSFAQLLVLVVIIVFPGASSLRCTYIDLSLSWYLCRQTRCFHDR